MGAYTSKVVRSLDRYELLDVLGTGAFATVWRAHDPVLDRDVAIKVLADNWSRDVEMRERFLAEARTALDVTNEHLIRVHHVAESGDETNTPYIVMALAGGGTLEERNRQRRLLTPDVDDSLRVIRDIAIATAALHNNGLLHRDLKPGNVLFQKTRDGEQRLVLGDFGLARAIDRSALTMVSGTPAYAAPEQAAGLTQLTAQADLYPLGVMFLEMVTGQLPTANDTMADTALSQIDMPAALAPAGVELEPDTRKLIGELLDPKPENRPGSAHEVANRINAILGETAHVPTYRQPTLAVETIVPGVAPQPLTPTEPPQAKPTNSPSTSNGAVYLVAAASVLGLVVLIGILAVLGVFGGGSDNDDSTATGTTTTTTLAPETTTTTTAPETTTTTAPTAPTTTVVGATAGASAEIPNDFPIPAQAILDVGLSNGALLRSYRIAGTPDELLAEYETFELWSVENADSQPDLTTFELVNERDRLTITAEPVARDTGLNVTIFEVEPS